jgi:RNA polymerase sigma factor (sigma-70 family)
MLTVLISTKFAKILEAGISKVAYVVKESRDWDDMTPEEQRKYLKDHPDSKRRLTAKPKFQPMNKKYDFMEIPDIQKSIKIYQETGSPKEFDKLRDNFTPMIANSIKRAVGNRITNKYDENLKDIKQKAALIFTKAIQNADPKNDGIVEYLTKTMNNQLMGSVREIFEPMVSIGPKHQKLLRKIHKYIHTNKDQGPIDYEQMAKDLSKDPDASNVTPDLIANLLQSRAVSLESEVGEPGEESSRTMHDVLGPASTTKDFPGESPFYDTPEESATKSEIKEIVRKSIKSLDDPQKEQIISLFYGIDDDDPLSVNDIAEQLHLPTTTVRRELQKAEARLQGMKDIQKLRESKNTARFVKAFDEHIRFAYVPKTVVKLGKSYIIDDKYTVRKYANQLVCSCGKNCFHKEVVEELLDK